MPGYSYQVIVTDLDWPSGEVGRFYNGRADVENVEKLNKDDILTKIHHLLAQPQD